jgi:hypothetical protein
MRKLFLIIMALGIVATATAQSRTAAYMKKLPPLPKDSCNVSKSAVEDFASMVTGLGQELQEELDAIKEMVDTHMAANEENARDNAMSQMSQMYGISKADLEKMRNSKNMSAAEKQALANKMMSQQTNMTMDEAKSVSELSDAGKKAYAEAYAMEAMATQQTDPNQAAKNATARNLYQLTVSQQAANSKVSEIANKISALYTPVDSDPERRAMLNRMAGWQNQLTSMMGIVSDQDARIMDSLSLKLKNEKIAYCTKYTSKYRAALRRHLEIMKASLPDYQNLGNLSAENTKAQTGIEMPAEGKEIPALTAIKEYLEKLRDAYQYKLYFAEDDY